MPTRQRGGGEVPTIDGRPHRLRPSPKPANRQNPRRPEHGDVINWLQAFVFRLTKAQSGHSVWVEMNLTGAFNAKGISLSWGRELWHRLRRRPLFNKYVKVRYVQKRLTKNGCFVIIAAWRPHLRFDQEPLFYGRDRETPRHVRANLRAEDLEFKEGLSISHTYITPKGQPSTDNCGQTAPASIERSFGPNKQPQSPLTNSKSLEPSPKTYFVKTPYQESKCHSMPSDWRKARRQPSGLQSVSNAGNSDGRVKISNGMRRKIAVMIRFLESDYWPNERVPFSRPHAFNFIKWALLNGFVDLTIRRAWRSAMEKSIRDTADGLPRSPVAWCQAEAKRILREMDPQTKDERISQFYTSKQRIKMDTPAKPTAADFERIKQLGRVVAGLVKKPDPPHGFFPDQVGSLQDGERIDVVCFEGDKAEFIKTNVKTLRLNGFGRLLFEKSHTGIIVTTSKARLEEISQNISKTY